MSSVEFKPSQFEKPLSEKQKRKLRTKELFRATRMMEDALPGMTEQLIEDFKNEKTTKGRVLIAGYFSRQTGHRELVAKSKGLSKLRELVQAPKTIVNISVYGELPIEERIKRIQAEVSNIPMIQPEFQVVPEAPQAQALPVPPERATIDVPPVPDPSVVPVPDRPTERSADALLTRAEDL